jgi:hypothetical protein
VKRIPNLFVLDDDGYATDRVTPGCEWVLSGHGVALRQYEGVCVERDEDGDWWVRHEVQPEEKAPLAFRCSEFDQESGYMSGWIPIETSAHKHALREALENGSPAYLPGTYELCGPGIAGNPMDFAWPGLIRHLAGQQLYALSHPFELTYEVIGHHLFVGGYGAVWWAIDGSDRKAKVKRRHLPE